MNASRPRPEAAGARSQTGQWRRRLPVRSGASLDQATPPGTWFTLWAPLSSRYSSTNTSLSLSISAFQCQRTQWGRSYVLALRCRVLALLGDFPFLCPNVLIQSLIASALIRAGSSSVSHQSLATPEVSQLYFSEAPMLFPCAALPAPLSSPGG